MATYYVDANGDDTKDGLSQANAWKTIGKVNATVLAAGDTVLFKRGETWTDAALTIGESGTAGNPITFGAYGSGAKPIFNRGDAGNCVWCNGFDYQRFENIEAAQGLDFGFAFFDSRGITLIDCDAHDCGNDQLLFFDGCYECEVQGGTFYNGYQRAADTNITGIEIGDGCHDVDISNVTCYDNIGTAVVSGLGISIHSHLGATMPYNITITGATCYGNTDYGINIWKQDNTADTPRNIVVQNCTFYNNDEGIRVHKSAAATNYPKGVTIIGCRSEGNTTRAFYLDGDNLAVRRCVFEGRGDLYQCHTMTFVNNTLYFAGSAPLYPLYIDGARTGGTFWVKNNILYRSGTGGMILGVDLSVNPPDLDIDYNLYYQASEGSNAARWYWRGSYCNWNGWKAVAGRDTHSPRPGDPAFVDPVTIDYDLQDNSPAIDAGVDVGLAYNGAAPDIGAYEWADTSGISAKTGNHDCEYYTAGALFGHG